MLDYRKLLRNERAKENPDDMKLLYYKYKLGIAPVQKTEVSTYFDKTEKYLHKVNIIINEISVNSFKEYLDNINAPDKIINNFIFD